MFELVDAVSQQAVIKVIGVGGGGGNAVEHMLTADLEGVDFINANTDAQMLSRSNSPTVLQLGESLTKGLGAGANPEIGRQAAVEDRDRNVLVALVGAAVLLHALVPGEHVLALVGDAAHQTPPFLGQGMNMGMRDVINLSWKLGMVLTDQARPELLAAYEAERRAHAHDMVDWAVSIGKLMEHLTAVEAAESEGRTPPKQDPSLMAAGYGQARETPPLRGGVLMTEQVAKESPTGYLLTQPIVETLSGEHLRLDNLFGDGFAIVASQAEDLELDAEAQTIVDRLGITCTAVHGLTEVKGHLDRGLESAAALLLRPDRYVFGHTTDTLNLSELVKALAAKLHLQ